MCLECLLHRDCPFYREGNCPGGSLIILWSINIFFSKKFIHLNANSRNSHRSVYIVIVNPTMC